MALDDRGERSGGRPVVGVDPDCLLSHLGSRGYPVRSRRSETKIAVDKGAAFSRACASETGPPSWRRPITHTRRARTNTSITVNPATSNSTATIGHMFPYESGCCVGELPGHADIRTTTVYIAVNTARLEEAVAERQRQRHGVHRALAGD